MNWQPIETCPKVEGIQALFYDDPSCVVGEWQSWGWVDSREYRRLTPTHWMPLPEPPQ